MNWQQDTASESGPRPISFRFRLYNMHLKPLSGLFEFLWEKLFGMPDSKRYHDAQKKCVNT
jgi:hypothetical protein